MNDLWTLSQFMLDVSPSIEMIEGRFFLDRFEKGQAGLLEEIKKYDDVRAAQQWMNKVPIDVLFDEVVGTWSMDDPAIQRIADVYAKSWLATLRSKYGSHESVSVELLKDEEAGDVIIYLKQT